MARPQQKEETQVSLFPFLSILACIIGCLTLVIVALSILQAQQDGREPEEVERAKEYLKLEKEREEEGKKIDSLRQRIDTIIIKREDLSKKQEELKVLETELELAEDVDLLREELIAENNRLGVQLKQLASDEEVLMTEIEVLKKEVASRDLPPDEPAVLVRPSGSGINLRPYFVEVTAAAVLLHLYLDQEPARIPIASIASDEKFLKLVEAVAGTPNGQIVFLIRGDALTPYTRAKRVADAAGARNAKLPLSGQGKLDLSMFENFLQKAPAEAPEPPQES